MSGLRFRYAFGKQTSGPMIQSKSHIYFEIVEKRYVLHIITTMDTVCDTKKVYLISKQEVTNILQHMGYMA